jgi:hypothetical protein
MGEKSNGKAKGKQPLGRPKRRWVDKIKMDLEEIGWLYWSGSGKGKMGSSCGCGK